MNPFERAFKKKLSSAMILALGKLFGPDHRVLGDYLIGPQYSTPFVRGVPRFVRVDSYASSFSYQWSAFSKTQLDSFTNSRLTKEDLVNKLQLDPADFAGKLVLDVGVGIGRHAEHFARNGALVVGVDLSSSVEQASDNLREFDNAVVFQADLFSLPFVLGVFELVYSIGVLHHTPNWSKGLYQISQFVGSGGLLSCWIYGKAFSRRDEWIKYTSQFNKNQFMEFCSFLSRVHRDKPNHFSDGGKVRDVIERHFPFSTHHESEERTVLALFDGYSPQYHAVATSQEVATILKNLQFDSVQSGRVEASALGRKK